MEHCLLKPLHSPSAPTCLFVCRITAPSVSAVLYTCAKFRQRKAIRGSAKQRRTSARIGPAVTQTASLLVGKQTAEHCSGLSAVKTGGPTFPSVCTFCGLMGRLMPKPREGQLSVFKRLNVACRTGAEGSHNSFRLPSIAGPLSLLKKWRSESHGKRF